MDIYKCPNSIFKKESLQKKILKNPFFFLRGTCAILQHALSQLYSKKTPDCIRKTWKNPGKSGKIWENLGKSGKCTDKIGQNRIK